MTAHPSPALAGQEHALSVVPAGGDALQWNAFVDRWPETTFCHRAEWRTVMEEVLGHECVDLVAVDASGRWQGALPLVRMRSRLFGHFLLSLPFLNYGGPVGTPPARTRLVQAAMEEARRSGADHLEIRSRHEVPGPPASTGRKVTVLLDLPPSSGELWKDGFRSKLRSQIRKPMKEGMETRFGHAEIGPFHEVFAERMRDLGTPVLPLAFFERAAGLLGERVVVGTVRHEGRAVAGGFGFLWRDELEMTWAASCRELDRLAPNMLLYWSFMEHAIERGAGVFNFGRCTPGGGTHRFKRQWGGRDVPLPWLHWSADAAADGTRPDGALVRLATAAWQRLPLGLANRAGPRLARNLPL